MFFARELLGWRFLLLLLTCTSSDPIHALSTLIYKIDSLHFYLISVLLTTWKPLVQKNFDRILIGELQMPPPNQFVVKNGDQLE
jgi:hypothetical protein